MTKVSNLFPGEHTSLFEINKDSRFQPLRHVNAQKRKGNEKTDVEEIKQLYM